MIFWQTARVKSTVPSFLPLIVLLVVGLTGCTPIILFLNGDSLNEPIGPGRSKADVCERWNSSVVGAVDGTWSGTLDGQCSSDDMDSDWRTRVAQVANTYRWLAQHKEIDFETGRSNAAQECALYQSENQDQSLTHAPSSDGDCYSDAALDAAQNSNIAAVPALEAIHRYMVDSGGEAVDNLGHRRWLLANQLGPSGVGSTDDHSCMWVLDRNEEPGLTWTPWPPPGAVPMAALGFDGSTVDDAGWSIQSDDYSLDKDAVKIVDEAGENLSIDVRDLSAQTGSVSAIAFTPNGWTFEADKTYTVSVADTDIEYEVTPVDCTSE